MFVIIQAHEYQKYAAVLDQMFRLRKKVFADTLGWDVPVIGPYERDSYDALAPAYLVWCNDSRTRLYGGMRLMPTTGPTLLYDVFRETFPAAAELVAPGIWEGTRMCIDEEAIAKDFPNIDAGRAFSMMLLALCECALDHGIHTMISNYEPYLKRVYKRAGAEVEELGRADGYGKYPVCCGAFEVSDRVLRRMRAALGLTLPLYVRHVPARSVVTQFLEMAA
ncbi:N-acyl-L-homoserine lactone (AHL) synthase [Rhizobium sp. 9T]|uniref:Acyl-homoserine-lactone synthase n=1 Tax=Rhizobium croatiense TaxID=2867516 RepID=A0ABS7LXM1_9HYPH|nr:MULTISPECIES: acyl-homoserine-lactone synthase [Rhizobium]MBY4606177.1 N-acyl-L-homoserine lactone (AHL) synthase [Rhizobium croatiense]MBY4629571.1 N-acyl-L-homoserine lactone (AHL) synthase [Rhizobium croatiense]PDV90179.1 N-acyl-L-homoserine lactone (AHL) synthase [Rhizobium sp. H4]WET72417.1 acyl-homoserine-lactone synthase [Rhizobium croatiense]